MDALNPENAAIPSLGPLLKGTIFACVHFSSVIPSMVCMVEEWKTYPTLEATYTNTKGSITECTIPPAGDYMLLVCFVAFVDDTTKVYSFLYLHCLISVESLVVWFRVTHPRHIPRAAQSREYISRHSSLSRHCDHH